MVTAIYSFAAFGSLRGMEVWMLFWIGCIVLYFVLFSLFPKNRSKQGWLRLLLHYAVAEIMLDIICGIHLWRFPALLEYGVGIVYGLLLFAVLLGVSGIIATVKCYRKTDNRITSGENYGIK